MEAQFDKEDLYEAYTEASHTQMPPEVADLEACLRDAIADAYDRNDISFLGVDHMMTTMAAMRARAVIREDYPSYAEWLQYETGRVAPRRAARPETPNGRR